MQIREREGPSIIPRSLTLAEPKMMVLPAKVKFEENPMGHQVVQEQTESVYLEVSVRVRRKVNLDFFAIWSKRGEQKKKQYQCWI